MYKYYSISRPVSVSTIPAGYPIDTIENFEERTFIPELNREAWAVISFKHMLSEADEQAYELIPAHLTVIGKAYRATYEMWGSKDYTLDDEMTALFALRAIVKHGETVVYNKKVALWLHKHGVQVQQDKENKCWTCK